jgi:hypothetical protein
MQNPPSRFAVYRVEGEVIAWGLDHGNRLDVRSVEPGMSGTFTSVDTMSFLFGEGYEILRIDPELVEAASEEAAV